LDPSGIHGLIVAADDLSGTWGSFAVQTFAVSMTDGVENTTKIISAYGSSSSSAAKLARDYRGGGFSDWFLPAFDQLAKLYALQQVAGVTLRYAPYWTSTEDNVQGFSAWVIDFCQGVDCYSGPGQRTVPKNQQHYFRPVRAF
jgi:hypothetical protein